MIIQDLRLTRFEEWRNIGADMRHDQCCSREIHGRPAHPVVVSKMPRHMSGLDLSFLGTCRQIYEEAQTIPYIYNTFSFKSLTILDLFMQSTPLSHYIRSLRLDMYWALQVGVSEPAHFLPKIAMGLKELRELHLTIRQFQDTKDPDPEPKPNHTEDELMEILSCLTPLPLQTVTVVYLDVCLSPGVSQRLDRGRWTMFPKQEWSKCARKMLLA